MSLKAVLLDAGGTLIREEPTREAIYAEAARRQGIQADARALRACMYRVHAELPRTLGNHFRYSEGWFRAFIQRIYQRELGLRPERLPEIERELFDRFADPGTFRLFPGALELIEGLRRRGLVVGIVSNWSEALPGILEGLGVAQMVDFVLVSAVERMEKPQPELFARALTRASAQPEEAIFAGNDPELDVEASRAVGLRAVLVRHGGSESAESRGGDGLDAPAVDSLSSLGRWIEGELAT